MWNRSVKKNKLRYREFYGDGGSKRFNTVKSTYADIEVKKLECVGHVQKPVGCQLQNLKKKEKRLGGKGKLTDRIIDKLQNYYGIAIRSNKNNLKAMQAATRTTLFHVASSKENNLHYPHCPTRPGSWWKCNKDRADGTSTYKPGPGVPISIVLKFKSICEELSYDDLQSKCLHGLTQNQKESFHAMIWDRLPKSRYVSFTPL